MSTIEQPRRYFSQLLEGDIILEANETHSFLLEMNDVYILEMTHIVKRQSFSPRVTVTREERGLPYYWSDKSPFWISLIKEPYHIVVTNLSHLRNVYPKKYFVFLVDQYFVHLNVQNMENFKNAYRIKRL
jgi:hypothetical protein